MSKPRLLGAYTKESPLITSVNADYAEIDVWADGNPDREDRVGYFVTVDNNTSGKMIVLANSTSDVRGVTLKTPGFSSNANLSMYDSAGNLLPEYSYVGFIGFVPIIDNGTCTINERCMPADDGTAVPSTNEYGYQVIERIDSTHVLILVEPQGDTIQRLAKKPATVVRVEGSVLCISKEEI